MKIAIDPATRKHHFLTLPRDSELDPDTFAIRFIMRRVNVSHSVARTIAALALLGGQQ